MDGESKRPEPSFRRGDTVYLKSGSLPLAVEDVGRETGVIVCRWTKADGEPREAAYPPQCLTLTETPVV
jgi:uncharacterized protein YodC (DUF2158 family)